MPTRNSSLDAYQDQIAEWWAQDDTAVQIAAKLQAIHVHVNIRTLQRRLVAWGLVHDVLGPHWEQTIRDWHAELGGSQKAILARLSNDHGINISESTLDRRLTSWQLMQRKPTIAKELDPIALDEAIAKRFYESRDTDAQIAEKLESDGHQISRKAVGRLRADLGLMKYKRNPDSRLEHEAEVREALEHEYRLGTIEPMGRQLLFDHMKMKYGFRNRDLIYRLATEIYPEGHRQRRTKQRVHRGAIVCAGPNAIWSMDGHCKLDFCGIEIYGAIDTFSRKIMWVYVGISSKTQQSVLAQYIYAIKHLGVVPSVLRTDRGVETPAAADAHWHIRKTLDGDDTIPFQAVYWYGTSKANQRIESWWAQLVKGCLYRWRDFFRELKEFREYDPAQLADRIAFLAIYMPIIRQQVAEFVVRWNTHKIRADKRRRHGVYGHPNDIYDYPEQHGGVQCGIAIDPPSLQAFEALYENWDLDEYLPEITMVWCKDVLQEGTFDLAQIDGEQSTEQGERIHLLAYLYLRDKTREHIETESWPQLGETDHPLI